MLTYWPCRNSWWMLLVRKPWRLPQFQSSWPCLSKGNSSVFQTPAKWMKSVETWRDSALLLIMINQALRFNYGIQLPNAAFARSMLMRALFDDCPSGSEKQTSHLYEVSPSKSYKKHFFIYSRIFIHIYILYIRIWTVSTSWVGYAELHLPANVEPAKGTDLTYVYFQLRRSRRRDRFVSLPAKMLRTPVHMQIV